MTDLISRRAAVDYCYQLINVEHQHGSDEMNYGQERVNQTETILHHLELMPSAEPQWIPCSERMPEDDAEVIVSCTDDSGDSEFSYTTTGWHFKGMWVVGNERTCFVRAWMPLPKPYEGEC